MKRVLIPLLLACTTARAQSPGAVSGVVIDAASGEPLARVQIHLPPYSTVSDDQGRFQLTALPPADYQLQVSTVGYRVIKKSFSLAPAETQDFEIRLSPDTLRQSLQVSAGPFDALRQDSPSQLSLAGTEAKNLASVLADDPLRAVQAMPGVVSDDDFNSRFSVRGASFSRIGVYLDDVLLHSPFHTVQGANGSGSLTIFNGDMLEDLSLYPGTMPSKFADRTAGALDVHTRDGSRTAPSVRITASMSNAGILAEGPLGASHHASWLITVRKSYLQYLLGRTSTDTSVAFGFFDTQGRLSYDLARRHTLTLNLIDGFSTLDRSSAIARLGINSMLDAVYHFTLANLGWRYTAERFLVTSRAVFLREKFQDRNPQKNPLGAGHYGEWTGNVNATWMWSKQAPLDFGASVRRVRDAGFANQYQLNPPSVRSLSDYRGHALREGGYLQQGWSAWAGKLHLEAGGRWDQHSVDRVTAWSPYASLALAPRASTRFQLGWGQYAQFPELQSLFSKVGNTALEPERATHFVAAVEQRFGERTRLRVEAYQRNDRDLLFQPFFDPRLIAGRIFNPPATPPILNSLRGYARGFEIFLQRRSANRLTGWISYALGYARLRDGVARIAFPADEDQRHTVNVYAGYRVSPSVNLSVKWIYGSGLPLPGFYRRSSAAYFLAEDRNGIRFDPYQRTDARINKAWPRAHWKITLYGEVVNLTNRTNYRWDSFDSYNSRTGQVSLTLDKMFPILPSVGLVIER